MKEENAFLKDRVATQTQEQSEMYHYLHGKMDRQLLQIAELEREAIANRELHEQALLDHAAATEAAQRGFQQELDAAMEQVTTLREQLTQVHAFVQHKDEIEQHVEELETEIARQKATFAEEALELERKSIFEKDRVKKEMLVHMKETKEELLQRTEGQLSTTTKRTMMENDHFMAELSFQSKETEKVIQRFQQLEQEAKALRVKNQLLEANEVAMAKKNFYYQKILQKLQQQGEQMVSLGQMDDRNTQLNVLASIPESPQRSSSPQSSDIQDDVQQIQTERLETELAQAKAHAETLEQSLRRAHDWIQLFQQEKQYLVAQQDEIIQFLCRALADITNEMRASGANGAEPQSILALANNTSTMEDLAGAVPSLDELSTEDTRLVVQLLLEKMRQYQDRFAVVYNNRSPGHGSPPHHNYQQNRQPFATIGLASLGGGKANTRELLEKQLGVELPPIVNNSPAPVSTISSSPLKQKRRVFAHLNANPADSDYQHQLQCAPNATLLAMTTSPFNFVSSVKIPSKRPQIPVNGCAMSPAKQSPTTAAPRRLPPAGNTKSPMKKRAPQAATASTASVVSATSDTLLSAWSTSSIPTVNDLLALTGQQGEIR